MDEKEDRFERVVSWAIDHCAVELNLDASLVVAGDPEVLSSVPPLSDASLGSEPWALVDLPVGSALLLRGDAGQDGPWLFVTTTSDGPLDAVTLQPSIWSEMVSSSTEGALTLPSGRLVVGEPDTVAAWGPTVAPDEGLVVQTKTGWDWPEPTYVGLIAVVQVETAMSCPLEIAKTAEGGLHSVSIKFPRPRWTPSLLRP